LNDPTNQFPDPAAEPDFRSGVLPPEIYRSDLDAPVGAARRAKFQDKRWKHLLFLLATLATTTAMGALHYAAFQNDFGRREVEVGWMLLLQGFWYSGTILLILGAHEMGHYLACRYYRVDATLPYFIPFFLPIGGPQTGTLGAVIRIREAFPNRKVLFDVGIAGPLAGFVVLVPALFIGMQLSEIAEVTPTGVFLGRPLLYQFARWMTFGVIPETHLVMVHPMVFAAWFGMLATALNLLPFGQLDGGHITYATLGRVSTPISLATVASAVVMTFFSMSWILMTVLMVAMLVLFGPRHPPVLNDYEPLGPGRRILAVCALVILIICFTPVPLRFVLP
jgi:membrane-associated protease RseP (regulator of RpoE activity)